MDTPSEEQQMFQNVTCNIAASEHEITEPNTLSVDFIKYVSDACFNASLLIFSWFKVSKGSKCRLRQKFLGWKS